MKDLKEALGASGFDPVYAEIAMYALKRGRNGEGRPFNINVVTRTTAVGLGTIALCGDELGLVAEVVDTSSVLEVGAEMLGHRVEDLILGKLADQHRQTNSQTTGLSARV